MSKPYNPLVYRFSVFTVLWTLLLFVAGALVTSHDAALSVPDWPLSYGTLTPPMIGGVVYEHTHRIIAGGLGIFVLIQAVLLWTSDDRRWLRWFGVVAVAGVLVQAVLGGEVVRQVLRYWLPVLHATFAQIIFGAVLAIAVFTSKWWLAEHPQTEDRGSPAIRTVAWANALVIFVQILLGAGFRHKEIPIWPHMAGSLAVLGMVIYTAAVLRKRFDDSEEFTRARTLLHAVFGTQFLLGLGAYWSRVVTSGAPKPLPVMITLTVAHTVVGAVLFALAVVIVLLCYRLVPSEKAAGAPASGRAAAG